jgi:hypothetical protein
MQILRIWVLFGTLILAACPALLVAQTDSGRITGHSEVIQSLPSHVIFDGRASVPIKLSH